MNENDILYDKKKINEIIENLPQPGGSHYSRIKIYYAQIIGTPST